MNMTAKSLFNEKNVPVEIPHLAVKGWKDGFTTIRDASFVVPEAVLVRMTTHTKNSYQVIYFDGKAEQVIVVPPEFMFKTPEQDKTAALMEKYREYTLKNLSSQLGYSGMIGADPEMFVEDENGEIIPAFNFLGSKEKPNKGGNTTGRGNNNIYWDGFQAEFDVQANTCMGWVSDSLYEGLLGLYKAAKKFSPKAKISIKTVFDIPLDLIKNSAKEHVQFGCRESLNVYGMEGIKAPGEEVLYRSTGGHIHFGLPSNYNNKDSIQKMVKALDAVLGIAGVSLFAKFDDPRRRQMYGLAGEYRTPPHGMEYRTLSNAWMFHPLIANLVIDLARSTAMFGAKDFLKFWQHDEAETIRIINECDVDAARKVLALNKKVLLQIIYTKYGNMENAELVYDIILNGMESAVSKPDDVEGNWHLKTGDWKTHCSNYGANVSSATASSDKV